MSILLLAFFSFCFLSLVSAELENGVKEADTAWMIVASCLVMFMTPGLAFFYGGLVRQKSFVSILGQCFIIYAVVTAVWAFIGYSLAFGDSKSEFLGGVSLFALQNVNYEPNEYAPTIPGLLFYFYQNQFAAITPCLFIGAMAERVRFSSIVILCPLWIVTVYCPIAHWNWNTHGFLKTLGVHDFAGGNVIHLSAGTAALVCAIFTDYVSKKEEIRKMKKVGEHSARSLDRKTTTKHGRQVQENSPEEIQVSSKESTAFVVLGTSILWYGWFGFNAGSALAASHASILALINTNLGASAALITWYVLERLSGKKASVIGMCIGAVCGLVGVTPACGFVPIYASGIIGSLSSLATFLFYRAMDRWKYKPDDRLGVFGCHGVSGVVGSILIGFFADIKIGATMDGIFQGGSGRLLGIQIAGIFCSFLWSLVVTSILVVAIHLCGWFKTLDENDESEIEDFDEQAVFMPNFEKLIERYRGSPKMKEFELVIKRDLPIETTANVAFSEAFISNGKPELKK